MLNFAYSSEGVAGICCCPQQDYNLVMNWIILIIAGLCESGFAFCLGKMKGLSGTEFYLWGAGFLIFLILSMALLAKAVKPYQSVQLIPYGPA